MPAIAGRASSSRCSSAASSAFLGTVGGSGPQRLGERRRPPAAAALRGGAAGPARCAQRRLGHRQSHATRRLGIRRRGRGREAARSGPSGRARHRVGDCALRSAATSSRRRRCARRRPSANGWTPARRAQRIDLRDLPLVTIDGEDARDFDDAVYAEPHAERLSAHRRDRRRESLRAPGHRARCRGAATRYLGIFSDARAADAADGAVGSPVLARAARRSAVLRRRHAREPQRRAEERALLSGRDALGGAPHLHARQRGAVRGPAGGARAARAAARAAHGAGGCVPRALQGARAPRRAGLRCRRSASSSSTRASACVRSSCASRNRGPSPDRGVHDSRQRRGRAGAREDPYADAVPRARHARGRRNSSVSPRRSLRSASRRTFPRPSRRAICRPSRGA